ncbi:MAG TPA: hypothetical protein IAB01_04620 [Candidatus Avidesulfovibrio excrementigallinarum]|nr:hypothetical protein [Candidatus Avidesulfovibrio excrementigallinarum]
MLHTVGRKFVLGVCALLGGVLALQAIAVACLCLVIVLSLFSRQDFRRCCVVARRALLTGQAVLRDFLASRAGKAAEE